MKRITTLLLMFVFVSEFQAQTKMEYNEAVDSAAVNLVNDLENRGEGKVAIWGLTDSNNTENQLSYLLEDDLTISLLRNSNTLGIVERKHLERILDEHALALNPLMSDEAIAQLGELEAVDVLVTGTLIRVKNDFKLHLKALSTRTGLLISAHKYWIRGDQEKRALFEEKRDVVHDENHVSKGRVCLLNSSGKRKEVILFFSSPENDDQRAFRQTVILSRMDKVVLEDVPSGQLSITAYKHRKKKSMLRSMWVVDNPIARKSVKVTCCDEVLIRI